MFWYVRFYTSICSCVLVGFNCCAAFVGLGALVAPASRICSFNIAPVEYEGDGKWKADGATYADEYDALLGIVVVAIIMLVFQCCICVPCIITPVKAKKTDGGSSSSSDEKKEKKSKVKHQKEGHTPVNQSDATMQGNVTAG